MIFASGVSGQVGGGFSRSAGFVGLITFGDKSMNRTAVLSNGSSTARFGGLDGEWDLPGLGMEPAPLSERTGRVPVSLASAALLAVMALAALAFAPSTGVAASASWTGSTDSLWSTTTNWTVSPVPGPGDTATFDSAGNANTTVNLGSGVTLRSVVFDTANAAAYTIGSGTVGSQTLTLEDTGSILMNATVAATETINSNVVLGTATASSYTLTNESLTNSLVLAGGVLGGTGGTPGIESLTVNGAGTTALNGVVSNGGASAVAVTKSGSGTLTLGGTNTYTGTTTINAGRLAANSAAALGTGGNITFGGGTLVYSAAAASQDWSARIKNSTGQAIRVDLNGQNLAFAGIMDSSNTGGLNVAGLGRLVLSGANGFTGGTTVTGSTLSISGDGTGTTNQLGAYPGSVTAANITLNGGATLEFTGAATLAANRGITLGSGFQRISKPASVSPVIQGVIAGTGGLILQDQRPGNTGGGSNLSLSGANTFGGITTLAHGDRGNQNGGRYALGNVNALQNSTVDYLNILGLN